MPQSPCPELRPPLEAIPFVRDMAHSFPALRFPVGPRYFDRADSSLPTAERTSPKTVICFLRCVCWRSFLAAYPGDLHPVRPITVRHLATMSPLPSSPHAGIFASLAGKVVLEFPDSTLRCVLAPRSCLLDAGGSIGTVCDTLLLIAATLVPFWSWRSISQFRHSIVTTL